MSDVDGPLRTDLRLELITIAGFNLGAVDTIDASSQYPLILIIRTLADSF